MIAGTAWRSLMCVGFVGLVVACGSNDNASDNGSQPFSMTPADGWTKLDNVEGLALTSSIVYGAPVSGATGFRDNVNVLIEPDVNADLDEYQALSAVQQARLGSFSVLVPASATTLGGEEAFSEVWSADLGPGGEQLRFWSVITIVDGDAYIWTYTAHPATFDEHRAGAEEMLEAFEFN